MHRTNNSIITLALVVLLMATLACNVDQTEKRTTLFDQYYIFEPKSLMDALKAGDMTAVSPVNEEPGLLPVDQQMPVNWLQADYFYIAITLYDNVLDETLQGWQLDGMSFSSRCSYIQKGFQNGRFAYFKVTDEKEQASRITRFIDIDPRGNFIHIAEWEFYPYLANPKSIDLAQLKISADLAIQIAESNGGKQKRQNFGDACNISLGLYPNAANYAGWVVSYTRSDDSTSLFEIHIDPYTGEIN